MNISRKWLKEFVDITATDKEYDEIMTIAGQKVETDHAHGRRDQKRRRRQGSFDGEARKLRSYVGLPGRRWQTASRSRSSPARRMYTEGDLVPVAQHNSYLPGGVHITKGKLRGVESCGMLCSFKELGLTVNDCPTAYEDGIWILNNEDVRDRRGHEQGHRQRRLDRGIRDHQQPPRLLLLTGSGPRDGSCVQRPDASS